MWGPLGGHVTNLSPEALSPKHKTNVHSGKPWVPERQHPPFSCCFSVGTGRVTWFIYLSPLGSIHNSTGSGTVHGKTKQLPDRLVAASAPRWEVSLLDCDP